MVRNCRCGKRTCYGEVGKPAECCKSCRSPDMVSTLPKCQCGKSPCYGFPNRKAMCCVKCKSPDMVCKTKRCRCGKSQAHFGFAGQPVECCKHCRDEGMTSNDIKCLCGTSKPTFKLPGGKAMCCYLCKSPEMISRHRKCICGKRAVFGLVDQGATHCKDCKSSDMMLYTKCFCKCGKARPHFGMPEGPSVCCMTCKTPDMVAHSRTCCSSWCETRVGTDTYEGYCYLCYVHLFPDQNVKTAYKDKERYITDCIKHIWDDRVIDVTFDKVVQGGTSRRRPDILLRLPTHVVVVEIDEHQHDRNTYCSCENKRMMEIFQDIGHLPVVYLRFNPDAWVNRAGQQFESCFNSFKNTGAPVLTNERDLKNRLAILEDRIMFYIKHPPSMEITIEHLYYDGFM